MFELISEWQAIRAKVWQAALRCLSEADVHESASGLRDRRLHLTLPPRLFGLARQAIDALRAFADAWRDTGPHWSKKEQNQLQATLLEIERFILQERPGADLPLEVYKQVYRADVKELLDLVETIIEQARTRGNGRAWVSKAYSRGAELTLGVEEEYKIVSEHTLELVPDAEKFFARGIDLENASIDGEVYRSQLELKTGICESVAEVESTLVGARTRLHLERPDGLLLLSAGTHPFSSWSEQQPSDTPRVALFMHDLQDVVRQLLVSGLHVHVGVSDRELAVKIIKAARQFLPLLLALSTSSAFWQGRATGLMSYRRSLFSKLPRTGLPPTFGDYSEYQEYLKLLTETKSFDSVGSSDPTKIWWDIRIHPVYPTVEFRVCDACTDVRDSVALAGLIQGLVGTIARLEYEGLSCTSPPRHVIEENMWRASRHGRSARYLDISSGSAVTSYYAALNVLDFVDDTLTLLGTRELVRERILRILDVGTSADRQLYIYRQTKNIKEVTRDLAQRFVPKSEFNIMPARDSSDGLEECEETLDLRDCR